LEVWLPVGKGRHEHGVKYKLAISVMFTFTIGLWHTLWHGASLYSLFFVTTISPVFELKQPEGV
jgi:hypothetical protein